jgi:hypothetical protein
VLSWLSTAFEDPRYSQFVTKTNDGHAYFKKIHGPIPYLLDKLRKLPGIQIAPQQVLDKFVLTAKNDTFVESMTNDQLPWAITGTMGQLSPAARKNAIERCPEIKMVSVVTISCVLLCSFLNIASRFFHLSITLAVSGPRT